MSDNYKLPKDWEVKKLEELTTILGDGLHGTPKYTVNGDYYFINGNNLNDGKIEFDENTKRVNINEFNKHKKNLNDRTVLVSINGTLGNVAYYNNEKIILGKSACYFNLKENVDKTFIKYLICSPYFIKYAHREATGTTIKNVSLKSMRNFFVPIPSLHEQQRIVKIIERKLTVVDKAKKASVEQKITIEKLITSLIQNIIYSKEWGKNNLGNICEFVYGDSLPKQNRVKGNVPVYGSNGQIDLHNKSLTKGKTIIVGRKGSIGEVHYSENDCWVIDTAYYVKPLLEVDLKYLYLLLKTLNLSKLNKASSIPGLNRDDVYKIDVPLPPLEQQQQIVNLIELKFNAIEKLKNIISEQSTNINALPSSILRKAFNGDY